MTLKTTTFDPAEYLEDDDVLAEYLTDAIETQDAAYIAHSLGVVARAKGMSKIARDADVSRESLYRALSAKGNPEFGTVLKVVSALGLKLTASPENAGTI